MSEDIKRAAAVSDALMARAEASKPDVSEESAASKLFMLQHLVRVLESGMKIVSARHYQGAPEPEPYPGACAGVVEASLRAVRIARNSGLLP